MAGSRVSQSVGRTTISFLDVEGLDAADAGRAHVGQHEASTACELKDSPVKSTTRGAALDQGWGGRDSKRHYRINQCL